MDIAGDVASEAGVHAKQVAGDAVSGVKEFSTEFIKQLFGGGKTPPISDDDLAKKKEADDTFSNSEYLQTRAQVEAIYNEYRAKKQREEQMRQQQDVQQEETKKIQELNQKRAVQHDVVTAMGKGSAETGRNYGAE